MDLARYATQAGVVANDLCQGSMRMVQAQISSRMLSLQASYIDQLRRVHTVLMTFLEKLRGRSLSTQSLTELNRLAHKLAGSAGTYGFEDLGNAARRLEVKTDAAIREPNDIAIISALSILLEEIDNIQLADPAAEAPAQSDVNRPEEQTGPRIEVVEPVATQPSSRSKILVVDDDPMIVALVENLLNASADVISLSEAAGIFQVIESHKPDLILLDDDLAGMTGVSIVEQMQEDEKLCRIPVIMLTGNRDPRNVMRAVDAGAVDYYTKPFEPLSFAKTIRTVLARMKYTVMIVDDDQTIHDLLRASFRMNGLQVMTADNGRDALDLMRQERKPDLIILDRMMPGLEGGAVLHNLQQDELLRDIPVIMLTARNAQGDAHSWMRRGVADFMEKPFNPEELILRSLRILDADDPE